MNTISAIIVDDEEGNVITLKGLIDKYLPEIEITGIANNKNQAKELIGSVHPKIVFLDIEMPHGSGFNLLDELEEIDFETIFVTAYDNYAIQAFKYAAIDYILKPVNIGDLKEAVSKAIENIKLQSAEEKVNTLISNLRSNSQNQKIGIDWRNGLKFIRVESIMYLTAAGGCTEIFLEDGEKLTTSKILKDFEDVLPNSNFMRIHNSHIINLNFLKHYYKGRNSTVEMEDGVIIEVSVRKREEFLSKISS